MRKNVGFLSIERPSHAFSTLVRRVNAINADYGHLSTSLDFARPAPRQFGPSRERQRLPVSTLILWPTSETG